MTLKAQKLFDDLDRAIRGLAKEHFYGLIVWGEPGIGKSISIQTAMEKLELVENEDYVFYTGHATSRGLLSFIQQNADKIIVWDDSEAIFRPKTSKAFLKILLDNTRPRIVSYTTTDEQLRFEFFGKMIFCANSNFLKDDEDTRAVGDRCREIHFAMTVQEKLDFARQRIIPKEAYDLTLEDRLEVLGRLEAWVEQKKVDFSFRDLSRILSDYSLDRDDLDEIISRVCKCDDRLTWIAQNAGKFAKTKDLVAAGCEHYGCSERTMWSRWGEVKKKGLINAPGD